MHIEMYHLLRKTNLLYQSNKIEYRYSKNTLITNHCAHDQEYPWQ